MCRKWVGRETEQSGGRIAESTNGKAIIFNIHEERVEVASKQR